MKTAVASTMTAKAKTTKTKACPSERRPEILREFFAASLMLAAIKSSDAAGQQAMVSR